MSALANVQATAGIEDDEDYDDMASRPGNTIGQPSIMNGLNRSLIHTTSTISNAPNVPVQHAPAPVLFSDLLASALDAMGHLCNLLSLQCSCCSHRQCFSTDQLVYLMPSSLVLVQSRLRTTEQRSGKTYCTIEQGG